jgi:aminopeptidase YwaD
MGSLALAAWSLGPRLIPSCFASRFEADPSQCIGQRESTGRFWFFNKRFFNRLFFRSNAGQLQPPINHFFVPGVRGILIHFFQVFASGKKNNFLGFLGIAFAGSTFAIGISYHKSRSMLRRIFLTVLIGSSFLFSGFAQKLKKSDKVTLANLQTEIAYLADDKLEGRRTGTPGEKLASDFIVSAFEKLNLQPKGERGLWLQPFEVDDGKQISDSTHFVVNTQELQLEKDYFPLAFSATKTVLGSPAIALQESGVPWFIDLKETLENTQNNPHFDIESALRSKARDCAKKGATAVVFFNSSPIADHIQFDPKDHSEPLEVPVLYLTREAKKKYLHDESASLDVKISVGITEKTRTGHNVIGFLSNGAAQTVVIGAHYDHLGYGEDGNSLYQGTDKKIHHGADDNASGTAALIELARLLKQSKWKENNYLFIAFSGEELGLLGSKYFTEHPTIDLATVNYMFNMDMIGRLSDSSHLLIIGGYGTSPSWGQVFGKADAKKYFTFKYDSSGRGPSDYTSFYLKSIPVLFFFTGMHSDYHRPTDDYNKINYLGELQVVNLMDELIGELNPGGKLVYTKTRDMTMANVAHFSVTLGIMPDYSFSGSGVRVDAVSEGRPAYKAGLQPGDIIVKLGDYPVSSLENYMQALGQFKKGDKTTVDYKRAGTSGQVPLQF